MEINTTQRFYFRPTNIPKLFITILVFVISCNVSAFYMEDENNELVNSNSVKSKLNKTTVEYYQKDNITNQVPYFDNRFRLDANLKEITLVFYRNSGSTPIILIRPDGSKIKVNNFDSEKVEWFDDSTFDMIKIKKPMPGPWQAVGDILPNSQILIVSDIKIIVEPLPDIAFSGETLKIEGRLFNNSDAIKSPHFKEVVNLDVNFFSTNNSLYENFGADAIKVTSFRDDGHDLDEYANDNIFTGEFILDFAPGEWQPVYLVKLPMSTRELRQTPILLHKTPVEISVVKSEEVDTPHQIILTIDPSYVEPDSFVFQGKFTFPDRQTAPFSIMESTGLSRTTLMTNTEPGIYRVNLSAFGKTIAGREFRLVVPEFSFNVEPINLAAGNVEESNEATDINTAKDSDEIGIVNETADELLKRGDEAINQALLAQQKIQEEKDQETLTLILAGNGVIIVVGLILFFILRKKKIKNKK